LQRNQLSTDEIRRRKEGFKEPTKLCNMIQHRMQANAASAEAQDYFSEGEECDDEVEDLLREAGVNDCRGDTRPA
jgi:hypothetical protein